MNEETPDQPDTHELGLDQLRLLGDLLSCLDAAGYDPKDTQRLQPILAAHLRSEPGSLLPGPEQGDQVLRPAPADTLLDTLDTAALIARSSLGTPSARRIRSLTSVAQIAEILRRRDQVTTTTGQKPPTGLAGAEVTETIPTAALPAEDHRPDADARPGRRARWRFRMPSARNLLITLSSVRAAEVAGQDGRKRLRRQSLGLLILLTGGIAAVSMWFTLSTVVAEPAAGLLAALTGLFVLGINRWLVTPWPADGGRRWASVIPRLVIAAVVGVLISTPIVLRVFQPAINTQVAIIKAETDQNAALLQAQLADLKTVIDSGGKAPLSPSADPQLKSLTKRLEAAQTSEQQAYQKWACEVYGQNCAGSSRAAGMGPRAQADAEALHNAQAQVAALANQIQQREKQLTANTQTAEAARYDTALQAVTATQQQADAARAQHNKTSNRLWIELQALNQLAGKNLTLTAAALLFLLLFTVIGCLPMAVKLLERPRTGKKLQQAATKRDQRAATDELLDSLRSAGAEEQVTALVARTSGQLHKRITPSASQDAERFFRASYTRLLARALYMGATKEEAEDAIESAMINMLGRWEKIRDPHAYTRRAVAHELIKQRRRPRRFVSLFGGRDHDPAQEEQLTVREDAQWVTALADRAAHAPLEDPGDVAQLLAVLRAAGADEQAAALADRAAAHVNRGGLTMSRPAAPRFWDALDPAEREALRSVASWRTFAAGARLMEEGERADHVMVILGGRAKVCAEENGTERVLAVRGLGQLVGERAALTVSVRSATVIALEMVWALVVQTKDFAAFISAHPRVLGIVQNQLYQRGRGDPMGHEDDFYPGGASHGTTVTTGAGRLDDEYAAGAHRKRPQPLNGENCTVFLTDVVEFGARTRTDADRFLIREALFRMAQAVTHGMPGARSEDRGDGFLTVVPPSVPIGEVLDQLLTELPMSLELHNSTHRESARFKLRLAVNVGPVVSDNIGISGEAIIAVARLAEAPRFKAVIAKSTASLGVIASPFVYETVIRHGADPRYSQVQVEVKESDTTAWMKLMEWPGPVIDRRPAANTESAWSRVAVTAL